MLFNCGILSTILLIDSLKLSEGNLFANRQGKIELAHTFRHAHDVIVNKEIWNVAEGHMNSLLVAREYPYDVDLNEPCSSPSTKWLEEQTALISTEDLQKIIDWDLFIIPFAYKLYVDVPDKPDYFGTVSIMDLISADDDAEYFGSEGEYTDEIKTIFEEARDFWAGSGVVDQIHIRGAHGSDLADREKLVQTLELLFEGSYDEDYTVDDHADEIQELILRLPGGYDFPLLTFNAFATDEMDDIDPSIVIGDGYFEFQRASNSESEGPEYALSHEFAHHVMYAMGLSFEDYKKEELMADAFAAYFLANNSGGDMTSSEIANVHRVAYSVGDCDAADELHHGTPFQRTCATIWGATFADSTEGRELNVRQLYFKFNSWYSGVDEMDADCVPLSSSSSTLGSTGTFLALTMQVLWLLC